MDDTLDQFKKWKKVTGVRASSISAYCTHLRPYCRERDPLTVDTAGIRSWLVTHSEHLMPATMASRIVAVRALHGFMVDAKLRADNPASSIRVPKVSEQLLPPATPDAIRQVLDAFPRSAEGGRDRLVSLLLYGCGLRVSEALALRRSDVDLDDRWVHVRDSKGRVSRTVPMLDAIAGDVGRHVAGLEGEAHVFPGDGRDGRYTRQAYARQLRHAARAAGLDPELWRPHMLRHAYATHLTIRDVAQRKLQDLLGHQDPKQTARYQHIALQDLARAVAAHPLNDHAAAAVPIVIAGTSTVRARLTIRAWVA